jgi:peptidoglycan/LPS O-acetylase OafA/YrhL
MSFMGSIGVFVFGIFGYFLYGSLKHLNNARLIGHILLVVALVLAGIVMAKEQALVPIIGNRSNLWALVFIVLVVSQCLAPIVVITNSCFSYLGRLSFGLYLCHPPIVYMLKPVYGFFYQQMSDGFAFLSAVIVTLIVLVPVARMMNFLIEEPGIRLGEKIIKMKVGKDFTIAQ